MTPFVRMWLVAFIWTLAIELPFYQVFLRRAVRPRRAVALGLAANVATHPALWFLAPRFSPYALWLVTVEAAVLAVEIALVGFGLRRLGAARPWRSAALAATVANAASTLFGLAAAGWLFG